MRLTIIGAGYVGLVTAACFAEMGNIVTCVDINDERISQLNDGIVPIFEPGLEQLIIKNKNEGRLRFTSSLVGACDETNLFFIAVGTPASSNGSANLEYVYEAARQIGCYLKTDSLIVSKSTVPVGTADRIEAIIAEELQSRGSKLKFEVISNPEFLKQGDSINDFMRPDRVVIGCESEEAKTIMKNLYAPYTQKQERTLFMSRRAAEMTKYAANAMIATKISFMNEIASLCEALDVDIESVRRGIGSDSRIGYSFIYAGCGYGGSCLPKDVKGIIDMARQEGLETKLLNAVQLINEHQKHLLFQKVQNYFGENLSEVKIGFWGLAFKPGTDDLREAPALTLLCDLIAAGAKVQTYDPVAMKNLEKVLPKEWFIEEKIKLATNQYEALKDADAMVLVTEWKPFRHPDFDHMKRIMRKPLIFDGRNQYDREQLKEIGFEYQGIGR
jgi:UDPglucose 6-dehydrogenase